MFGIGQPELIVILFILLLFIGPSRLPKLTRTIGESARGLREGFTGGKNDKSLKDITKEVSNSAKEFKTTIAEVRHPIMAANAADGTSNTSADASQTSPPANGGGYGEQGYGKEETT